MKLRSSLCLVILSAFAASCGSFGETAWEAAGVAADASEIKRCRDVYRQSGDAFRLQDCEAEAVSF